MSPLQIPESPDLFAEVKVRDEHSFAARLKQLACDVHADERFGVLKDRIRQVITAQGYQSIVMGRDPETGKPETATQTFERIYGEVLELNSVQRKKAAA